jgi:hypothetical protein
MPGRPGDRVRPLSSLVLLGGSAFSAGRWVALVLTCPSSGDGGKASLYVLVGCWLEVLPLSIPSASMCGFCSCFAKRRLAAVPLLRFERALSHGSSRVPWRECMCPDICVLVQDWVVLLKFCHLSTLQPPHSPYRRCTCGPAAASAATTLAPSPQPSMLPVHTTWQCYGSWGKTRAHAHASTSPSLTITLKKFKQRPVLWLQCASWGPT